MITIGATGITLGLRFNRISTKQALLSIILLTYTGVAILEWGDHIAIICIGSLLAVGFSLPILGYGLFLEKRKRSNDDHPLQ